MSDYRSDLVEDLKDPVYASKYLSAAYADSLEAFLVALRDVGEAQKGMTKLATAAGVNRENLYRMLSEEGNPRLNSLRAVLGVLPLRVKFEPLVPSDISEPKRTGIESARTISSTASGFSWSSAGTVNTGTFAGPQTTSSDLGVSSSSLSAATLTFPPRKTVSMDFHANNNLSGIQKRA
jgi:probable addiction module antidote protein